MERTQSRANAASPAADKAFLLTAVMFFIYAGTTAYGLLGLLVPALASPQSLLVVVESAVGLALSTLIVLLHKRAALKMSFCIQAFIHLFVLLAVIGEMFGLYYTLTWWDSMLHLLTGFGVTFTAYCLFDYLTRSSNLQHKFAICFSCAVAVSLAGELLWELAEFSIDRAFGTNMQKFMPEIEPFFNGGLSKELLNGTAEEIAAFFRTPAGYTYALKDTMSDMLLNLAGTVAFGGLCIATAKKGKAFYSGGFTLTHRTQAQPDGVVRAA